MKMWMNWHNRRTTLFTSWEDFSGLIILEIQLTNLEDRSRNSNTTKFYPYSSFLGFRICFKTTFSKTKFHLMASMVWWKGNKSCQTKSRNWTKIWFTILRYTSSTFTWGSLWTNSRAWSTSSLKTKSRNLWSWKWCSDFRQWRNNQSRYDHCCWWYYVSYRFKCNLIAKW